MSMPFARPATALAALCVLAASDVAVAQMFDCSGFWAVQTRLVTASDAANTSYRPGDMRMEQWGIRQAGSALQLTSRVGTIAGGIGPGYTLAFAGTWDSGLGAKGDIRVEAQMRSPNAMAGTIKVNYYSAQFGYQIGLDAWTFEAVRAGN